MNARLTLGTLGLIVMALASPVTAYDIVGQTTTAGENDDPVASALSGATLYSDNWWAGNTVRVDGATLTTVTLSPSTEEVVVGAGPITQGLVLCEFDDDTLLGVTLPANAGYGGRCSASSNSTGAPSSGVSVGWSTMTVNVDASASCGFTGTATTVHFFARVGNNGHGLEVGAGETFSYREILAYWIDGGHVTYFIATDDISMPRTCYGDDTLTYDSGSANTPASGDECNDTTNAGFDSFVPTTYDVLSGSNPLGMEHTVCRTV